MKRLLLIFSLITISIEISAQVYWPNSFKYPSCTTMPPATTNCTKWPTHTSGTWFWNDPNTWNGNSIPKDDDIVCIPSGYSVSIKNNVYSSSSCPAPADTVLSPRLNIFVCGSLVFEPSGTLNLACFSFIQIWPGGTIYAANGSSDLIRIGSTILWGGPGSTTQNNLTGPTYVASPAIGQGVLPAMFDYIKVNQSNPYQVSVEWGSLQEINSMAFIVERSIDQKTWSAIGTVKSVGNSSLKTSYSFTDKNPLSGTSYYRLKQVDVDGAAVYSDIVKVSNNQSEKTVSIYPNPVSGIANIYSKTNFKSGQQLYLIDAKGMRIKAYAATSNTNIMQIDLAMMKPGLYLLQVVDNGSVVESLPLIKQ